MIVALSPAKSMRLDTAAAKAAASTPRFAAAADALAAQLAKLPAPKLASMLGVSAPLGTLNAARYAAWGKEAAVAAAWAMDGPAYKALSARTLTPAGAAAAGERVRILSGLYGLLAPTDGIQPYRLEMGTKLTMPGAPAPTLYAHWGDRVARALEADARALNPERPTIVNAASQEYWKCVAGQFGAGVRVVTVQFPGPAVYAKAARGAIARFIAEGALADPTDLKGFTGLEGEWAYDAAASSEDTYVFRRGAAKPKGKVKEEEAEGKAAPAAKRARK